MTQATDDRTFSEAELTAIVADRVQRETASITAEVEKLRADNTELNTKLDVEISARQAAEKKATDTEAEFTGYKTQLETEKAQAACKDERITKVREAAAHLDDKFFTDEARVARITAMDEATFAGYLEDLKVTAGGASKNDDGGPPRETAMTGQSATTASVGTAARSFLGRGMAAAAATKEN